MNDKQEKLNSDSFWDISASKLPHANKPARSHDVPLRVEVHSSEVESVSEHRSGESFSSGTITRLVSNAPKKPNTERKLLSSYSPKNPLIRRVEIYTDNDADSIFAENNLFLRERRALLGRTGVEVPHVPFFSMMPRYSQMTRPQLAFYLWWRENIRRGVFIECDVSYALLYAHELIVSDDEPSEVLRALCSLCSCTYNGNNITYFGLGDIICDYCIIHNLSLPHGFLGDNFSVFISYCKLPEFFIDITEAKEPEMQKKIINAVSVYSYKKSKHYPSNEAVFETHMSGAVRAIFEDDRSRSALFPFDGEGEARGLVLSSQKPFFKISGLTAKQAKIKISYFPISLLRAPITDALRYTENKIREHLGIKSKLNVTTVNPIVRDVIDEYARKNCPAMTRERQTAIAESLIQREYERLYDLPQAELSLDKARDIEYESWQTTKILVETFAEGEEDIAEQSLEEKGISENRSSEKALGAQGIFPSATEASAETATEKITDEATASGGILSQFEAVLGEDIEFLRLCIRGDILGQRRLARERGISADELCETVNTAALDIMGDILLCESEGGYEIIDDYKNLFI